MNRAPGQFYPVDSPVHNLDPRAKIPSTALFVVGIFLVDSVAGFIFVAGALAALVALSHLPAVAFLRLLKPVAPVVVLTALFQAFFSGAGELLFTWGFLEVREGGLLLALFLASRILLLVAAAGLLTATTAPLALADGLEDLLSPLKRLRFPAHEVAMMTSIALRFIPTLQEEAQRITTAQAARGADFSEGGPLKRARAMLPVLVPLTVGAFRRADELAEAMESRGYRGGEGRTRYRELRFRQRDLLAPLAVLFVLAGGALL